MGALTLVVGGQKAGKSRTALAVARRAGTPVLLAPASPDDPELAERIARHRRDREPDVRVVEGFDLLAGLDDAGPDAPVVVDALDTWLLHHMQEAGLFDDLVADVAPLGAGGEAAQAAVLARVDALAAAAADRPGATVVVAGAVGMGVHGPSPATRRYEDLHGLATQRLGRDAAEVLLVVAGRAVALDALATPDRPDRQAPS